MVRRRPLRAASVSDQDAIDYPALMLKRGEDARLRAGHLWVFSNEIDEQRTPLSGFQPGDPCAIVDFAGKPIGLGYVNPNSLIAARLIVRGIKHPIDRSLLVHKLNVALALRERLYAEPYTAWCSAIPTACRDLRSIATTT